MRHFLLVSCQLGLSGVPFIQLHYSLFTSTNIQRAWHQIIKRTCEFWNLTHVRVDGASRITLLLLPEHPFAIDIKASFPFTDAYSYTSRHGFEASICQKVIEKGHLRKSIIDMNLPNFTCRRESVFHWRVREIKTWKSGGFISLDTNISTNKTSFGKTFGSHVYGPYEYNKYQYYSQSGMWSNLSRRIGCIHGKT